MKIGIRLRDLEVVANEPTESGAWRVELVKVGPNSFGVRRISQTAADEARCDALIMEHCREYADMNEPEA